MNRVLNIFVHNNITEICLTSKAIRWRLFLWHQQILTAGSAVSENKQLWRLIVLMLIKADCYCRSLYLSCLFPWLEPFLSPELLILFIHYSLFFKSTYWLQMHYLMTPEYDIWWGFNSRNYLLKCWMFQGKCKLCNTLKHKNYLPHTWLRADHQILSLSVSG